MHPNIHQAFVQKMLDEILHAFDRIYLYPVQHATLEIKLGCLAFPTNKEEVVHANF